MRMIRGGSDITMITALLCEAPLCRDCVATKTGVPGDQVDGALGTIATTLQLTVGAGRCYVCLQDKVATYRLATTNGRGRQPAAQLHGLWRYLEAHRGQLFCSACLKKALAVVGRIDRAVIAAEGRGATRRYGPCSICRLDRLLCGLAAL
ncbi:MAG: hypothetical protein ACREKH_21180 [Candidatus Rokuibacteriota bacterium]